MQNRTLQGVFFGVVFLCAPLHAAGHRLSGEARDSWARYTKLTEQRIEEELKNPSPLPRSDFDYLKEGRVQTQPLTTTDKGKEIEVKNGSVHHWHGRILVPAMDLNTLLPWLQEYDRYAARFKEVEESELRSRSGDTFNVRLGLTRTKFKVTVHYDTEHTVVYRRNGAGRASSRSEATRIVQLRNYGTPRMERLPEGNDDGYLWRLNSYWRFTERDGGVIVECESIGLSRPLGSFLSILNWFTFGKIKDIAESVARESLEDTLTALRDGVSARAKRID